MSYQKRIDKLMEHLKDSPHRAVALIPGPSLNYFTGLTFHLMERPVILLLSNDADPRMVLPELEVSKAEAGSIDIELFSYGESEGASQGAVVKAVEGLDLESGGLGIEPLNMRFFELSLLKQALPNASIAPSSDVIGDLRMLKEKDELDAMQEAARIAEAALGETIPLIQMGMTEKELASELTLQLLRAGSEPELHFSPIVGSGPNAALPHAVPSTRQLSAGDSLILDWGAVHEGYVSDITRTFFIAEAPEDLSRVHEIVQRANAAGRAAVSPGAACGAVDQAARGEIERAGYAEFFGHRTGHGLGLEAHEPPFIREGEQTVMRPGMTFTVEPGIYLRDRGAVRVEDDVVVTEEGTFSLTQFPREVQIIA